MRTIIILFILFVCSCENEDLFFCKIDECSYAAETNEYWLKNSIMEAITFWASHGVYLKYQEQPKFPIVVEKINGCSLGFYDGFKIVLDNDKIITQYKQYHNLWKKCVLVQEIGHSFGMEHVDSLSAMNHMLSINTINNNCFWSKEDQNELNRVLELQ